MGNFDKGTIQDARGGTVEYTESYTGFKGYYTRSGFLGYVKDEAKFIMFPTYEEYEEYLQSSH